MYNLAEMDINPDIIYFHCNYLVYYIFSTHILLTENSNLKRRKKVVIKRDDTAIQTEPMPAAGPGYLSASVLPFVLHLGFMAGTAFLVMHVEVSVDVLSILLTSAFVYHIIRTEHIVNLLNFFYSCLFGNLILKLVTHGNIC